MDSIHHIVREAEDNYLEGTTTRGKYVEWSMYETIETIDAYYNSKHTSGARDSLGREKPFFNIVTAAVNIWYRATDLDRKNIRLIPDKAQNTAIAFVATVLLQQWMKDSKFGVFLNQWGRTLAKYGSAVVKFVEQDGELKATVIPWNRLIVDPVDFEALPVIEKFYKTAGQLRKNSAYDQDVVDDLCKAEQTRKTQGGQDKDNQDEFIELYEVHGLMDSRLLEDEPKDIEEKDVEYVQQMHVIAFVKGEDNTYQDFTLYKGREAKSPYMKTDLIEEEDRTLGIGAVEYLFDPQWMVNHSMKNMKDTLDLSSKLIFQTSDKNFVGRNVLSAIESGDIMIHDDNKPLTQINNTKADVTALQNFSTMWQQLAAEITSTPDAIKGQTLPSGTPYSLGAYLGAQANSLFEIMTENKGLALENMMRTFILPYLKKKMNTKDEIVTILDENEVAEIDAMYVPREAIRRYNERLPDQLLQALQNPESPVPSPFNRETEEAGVRESLAPLGNKRFFKPDEIGQKTWNQALNGFEMEVNVEVTNENTDKGAVLQTLSSILQTISSNPAILQDPNGKMLFNQILKETAVISPLQITTAQARPSASPPNGGNAGALTDLNQANVQTNQGGNGGANQPA